MEDTIKGGFVVLLVIVIAVSAITGLSLLTSLYVVLGTIVVFTALYLFGLWKKNRDEAEDAKPAVAPFGAPLGHAGAATDSTGEFIPIRNLVRRRHVPDSRTCPPVQLAILSRQSLEDDGKRWHRVELLGAGFTWEKKNAPPEDWGKGGTEKPGLWPYTSVLHLRDLVTGITGFVDPQELRIYEIQDIAADGRRIRAGLEMWEYIRLLLGGVSEYDGRKLLAFREERNKAIAAREWRENRPAKSFRFFRKNPIEAEITTTSGAVFTAAITRVATFGEPFVMSGEAHQTGTRYEPADTAFTLPGYPIPENPIASISIDGEDVGPVPEWLAGYLASTAKRKPAARVEAGADDTDEAE